MTHANAVAWALAAGVPGAASGWLVAALRGWPPLTATIVGFAGATVVVAVTVLYLADEARRVAALLFFPGGDRAPPRPEFSLAEAFAATGAYDEALVELRRVRAEFPEHIEPMLRTARLLRDHLGRHDEAAHWLRCAMALPAVDRTRERQLLRELVELYADRLHSPRLAFPDLARFAERHHGTADAAWARRTLTEIKARMRQ